MSTQGNVGPESSLDAEVIHKGEAPPPAGEPPAPAQPSTSATIFSMSLFVAIGGALDHFLLPRVLALFQH